MDLTLPTLLAGAVAFLAGGVVKGIAGMGLPLMVVPLLASVFDPPRAIALMAVPVLTSNLWQALDRRHHARMLRRFWSLVAMVPPCVVLASSFLVRIDPDSGALVLGVIVVAFCSLQMLPLRLGSATHLEGVLNPLVGAATGLIGGLSNIFGPPLAMYLVALRLPKDQFVSAAALCFLSGSVPLYASLAWSGALGLPELLLSALGTLPMLLGLQLGARLRRRISAAAFHRMLIVLLLLIGLNLVRRGLGAGG